MARTGQKLRVKRYTEEKERLEKKKEAEIRGHLAQLRRRNGS